MNSDKLSLNTHDYDGNLPHTSELGQILQYNQANFLVNPVHVGKFIIELIKISCPPDHSPESKCLSQTLRSWNTTANYDPLNKLSVDELLFVCAETFFNLQKKKSDILIDFAKEFFLQFEDMVTGMCPQGRSTRLWQFMMIYVAFHPINF